MHSHRRPLAQSLSAESAARRQRCPRFPFGAQLRHELIAFAKEGLLLTMELLELLRERLKLLEVCQPRAVTAARPRQRPASSRRGGGGAQLPRAPYCRILLRLARSCHATRLTRATSIFNEARAVTKWYLRALRFLLLSLTLVGSRRLRRVGAAQPSWSFDSRRLQFFARRQ